MSENGPAEKSDIQDQADLLSEVIDELRYRPENPLEAALALYSGVQGEAWRRYQNILRTSRVVWEDDCNKAYQRKFAAVYEAWDKFQSVSEGAWETYRTDISFYDYKLRLVSCYTWQDYMADTSVVWSKYADATKPAYHDYCNGEKLACHQLDCITTDSMLRYKREARAAWSKYQSTESPAWADLQQVRKELRSAPDLSLERFEE